MKHFYVYYSYEEWGRGYIGKRECRCLPEEDVKYFGSFRDKTFLPTEKLILAVFQTKQEAIEAEIALHNFYEVDVNPHFANKAKQTSTAFSYDRSGERNSAAWRKRMEEKGWPGHRPEVQQKTREYQLSLGDRHNSRTPEGRQRARELFSGANNPNSSPEGRERCRQRMLQPSRNRLAKETGARVFSQLWMDPDHPELGCHNVGNLVQLQRRLGLPSDRGNRVKVSNEVP